MESMCFACVHVCPCGPVKGDESQVGMVERFGSFLSAFSLWFFIVPVLCSSLALRSWNKILFPVQSLERAVCASVISLQQRRDLTVCILLMLVMLQPKANWGTWRFPYPLSLPQAMESRELLLGLPSRTINPWLTDAPTCVQCIKVWRLTLLWEGQHCCVPSLGGCVVVGQHCTNGFWGCVVSVKAFERKEIIFCKTRPLKSLSVIPVALRSLNLHHSGSLGYFSVSWFNAFLDA